MQELRDELAKKLNLMAMERIEQGKSLSDKELVQLSLKVDELDDELRRAAEKPAGNYRAGGAALLFHKSRG